MIKKYFMPNRNNSSEDRHANKSSLKTQRHSTLQNIENAHPKQTKGQYDYKTAPITPANGERHIPSQNQDLQVSNELASTVIRGYILPMFESKEKHNLKAKYNKMTPNAMKPNPNSVYGELKLSDQLSC